LNHADLLLKLIDAVDVSHDTTINTEDYLDKLINLLQTNKKILEQKFLTLENIGFKENVNTLCSEIAFCNVYS